MIIHISFLFVSEPGFFVCLLTERQMPMSLKALTADREPNRKINRGIFKRQRENISSIVCLRAWIFCFVS